MFSKNKAEKIKFNLNGLYVAEMSTKKSGTIYSQETIICSCKKDSMGYPIYTDVLTKNKYRLRNDYHVNDGENIVFSPRSLTSILKNGEYKDTILKQGYLTKKQIVEIYNALNNETGYIVSKQEEDKQIIADSCTILNNKTFKYQPAIHLEEELEKLMISLALNKKIALIVGNPGNGTTTLVEYLAFLINTRKCPEFLLQKNILEVNLPSLQRKSDKKNSIEDRIKAVIECAKKNNSILFIDEADEITLPQDEKNQNILAMLRYEAERNGLKIIVTSTKKRFEDIKNSSDFKKQFDIITIHQLKEDEIKDIINRHIAIHTKDDKIEVNKEYLPMIISTILEVTSNDNTIMKLPSENPGLAVSIVERSFAIAKVKKSKTLDFDHISKALLDTKQLNPNKVEKTIRTLEELKPTYGTIKVMR